MNLLLMLIRHRRPWWLAMATLWCALAQAQDAPGASVDELLKLARERNPELATLQYEADAAKARVQPAGALPDPRLRTELMDISRGGQQFPTLLPGRVGAARYTLMQELPWFGKRDLKREVAELEAQATQTRTTGAWQELAAKIKLTFAQLYYQAQSEKLTREILDLMARLEAVAQVRYAGGLVAQQDVIRAQLEQTAMRNELIGLDAEKRQLLARMNALLGRPSAATLAMPDKLRATPDMTLLDPSALVDRALARNPTLVAEGTRIQSAEKTRDLTLRNRYPDVTLGLAPNQMQNSWRQWDVMLELSIPLQQETRRAQEREAEAMLTAARSRREAVLNQLRADLSENLTALDAARRTEALTTTRLLPQSELTFQAALAGYENGKVDFATLLDAQRQIRQARLNQLKARAETQARLAELEKIIGEDL